MQRLLNQIHKRLIKTKQTISVAESCTGGLASSLLTQLSGSSAYFILGVAAYSNKAKERILGITHSLIAQKGAVSRQVAQGMAESIRRLANTDFGIGITGIAGPTGGTPQKPVGTVFIAIDSKKKKICKRSHFIGSRLRIRKKTALSALKLLKPLI